MEVEEVEDGINEGVVEVEDTEDQHIEDIDEVENQEVDERGREDPVADRPDGDQTVEAPVVKEKDESGLMRNTVHTVPVPSPRRSTRPTRPPRRYDEYVMNAVVRPRDRKIDAVTTLLQSGVLSSLDAETAHKILSSVLQ